MVDYTVFGGAADPVATDPYRVHDPMFESVRIALAARGRPYSVSYLQGISGNAFRLGGPCPCAPTCGAMLSPAELLGRLGCRVTETSDPAKLAGALQGDGRPAIVFHAFSMAEWDVVAGYDSAKQELIGRHAGSGDKLVRADYKRFTTCGDICPVGGALLLGEIKGEPDQQVLELEALTWAVRHARAPRDRFLELPRSRRLPWRFRQGTACLEGWAHSFTAQPDRMPELGDRYALSVFHDTHSHAAPFLREIAGRHADAREPLEQAAQRFETSAAALAELWRAVFGGWEGYKQPDRAKAARSAELLTHAARAYSDGAGCLLGALASMDAGRAAHAARTWRGTSSRDGLVLDGVPMLSNPERRSRQLDALSAATSITAHPAEYTDLMGLSGLAFAPAGTDLANLQPAARRRLAWALGWTLAAPTEADDGLNLDALRLRLLDSLHAGQPVVATALGSGSGVIVGYADGGRRLLWHTITHPEPVWQPLGVTGAPRWFLGEFHTPPSLTACLRSALDSALDAWPVEPRPISAAELPALIAARRAASRFLRDWSTVATDGAASAMIQAADSYDAWVTVATQPAPDLQLGMQRFQRLAELDGASMRQIAAAAQLMRKSLTGQRVGRTLD